MSDSTKYYNFYLRALGIFFLTIVTHLSYEIALSSDWGCFIEGSYGTSEVMVFSILSIVTMILAVRFLMKVNNSKVKLIWLSKGLINLGLLIVVFDFF